MDRGGDRCTEVHRGGERYNMNSLVMSNIDFPPFFYYSKIILIMS